MVDAIATAAIGLGLGLSPFMLLSIGALIVVGYLILSINVYLESMAFGRFRLGYGFLGVEAAVPPLARELAPRRVNAVSPGVIETGWWDFMGEEDRRATFDQFPSKRPSDATARRMTSPTRSAR